MSKDQRNSDSLALADAIVEGMLEKKGVDIVVMNLSKISSAICDYFVICHGNSSTQVEGLADSIEEIVNKTRGEKPWHREGYENAEWILLDYVDVVAHVFHRDSREFYDLERLWGDAEIKRYQDAG